MSDVLKQKLDIAKRAGEIHAELSELTKYLQQAEERKNKKIGLRIRLETGAGLDSILEASFWDKEDTSLIDAVIAFIIFQIEKREAELNDLIKILS